MGATPNGKIREREAVFLVAEVTFFVFHGSCTMSVYDITKKGKNGVTGSLETNMQPLKSTPITMTSSVEQAR